MESKFIIVVVFVSLVQSFVALPLTVDYGLSEDQLACLTEIIVNQDAAVQANFDGYDLIFVIISKYASALFWNVEARTDDDYAKIAQALVRAKDAVDYFLNAVRIALSDKACDAVEVARSATYADLDDAYAVATSALTLAQSGNYSANRAQLEEYEARVHEDLENLVQCIYDSIRICLNTTDDGTLSVVQAAQDGSELGLLHATNAIFDGIKAYAVAVTGGTTDVSLIGKIEDFRRYAHIGLRADVEHKFSALKTLYIAVGLDLIEILPSLATNQYALTALFNRYVAVVEIIFDTIGANLYEVAFGLHDLGNAGFSLTDAAQASALANFNGASEIVLTSILSANPNAVFAVAATQKMTSITTTDNIAVIFNAIGTAQDQGKNSSESRINQLKTLEAVLLINSNTFTDLTYQLLHIGKTWDDNSEAEFASLRNAAPGIVKLVTDKYIESISILDNAIHVGEACAEDFSTIQANKEVVISAFDTYTQDLSAAGVIVIKAAAEN